MSTKAKLTISAIMLAMIGAVATGTVYSAFTSTTSNASNTLAAGTVALSDNDSGSALFSLSNMKPGDSATKCIKVDYTGTVSSNVRLYGTTTGTGLGTYVTLRVRRGSFPGSPPASNACTGFTSAATVYDSTLSAFPSTWAAGVNEGTWTSSTSNVYELVLTLQDNNSAQGLNSSTTFTWEAQST